MRILVVLIHHASKISGGSIVLQFEFQRRHVKTRFRGLLSYRLNNQKRVFLAIYLSLSRKSFHQHMIKLGQISIAAKFNLKTSQSGVKINPGGSILWSVQRISKSENRDLNRFTIPLNRSALIACNIITMNKFYNCFCTCSVDACDRINSFWWETERFSLTFQ